MIRAFYTASSGLVAQTIKQDLIANNIANVNTPGFKRQKSVVASFESTLTSELASIEEKDNRPYYPGAPRGSQKVVMGSAIDGTQGQVVQTGNKTDLAIEGDGEFEISLNGKTSSTRAGNFQINGKGELCTADGAQVMGESGPIDKLQEGGWSVTAEGEIRDKSGAKIDKIKIVGGNEKTAIHQASLEQANVSIMREMVDMIANMRAYEANQKVVQSTDGTLEKLINEVGKV